MGKTAHKSLNVIRKTNISHQNSYHKIRDKITLPGPAPAGTGRHRNFDQNWTINF